MADFSTSRFQEVAPRVWVARYDWLDVNITLVGGERGLLVVDTHSSERAAREVVSDVRRLGACEVVAAVNTHEHFDHTFGNVVLREEYGDLPIHAHEWAAEHTVSAGERIKTEYADWPASLDLVIGLLTDGSVVVPGHGAVVDREFVRDQRAEIGVVAETIRDLASRGVPPGQALDAGEWPFPKEGLAHAVRRGYDQLPRGARQLPLL